MTICELTHKRSSNEVRPLIITRAPTASAFSESCRTREVPAANPAHPSRVKTERAARIHRTLWLSHETASSPPRSRVVLLNARTVLLDRRSCQLGTAGKTDIPRRQRSCGSGDGHSNRRWTERFKHVRKLRPRQYVGACPLLRLAEYRQTSLLAKRSARVPKLWPTVLKRVQFPEVASTIRFACSSRPASRSLQGRSSS
jgi:hypothetical protein